MIYVLAGLMFDRFYFKFQVRPGREYRGLITILRNLRWNQIGKAQVCIHIIISLMLN
jgi:hypothetical protein